ncbi:MAG: hypothetical protein NTV09_03050 [Bacteroidetes bacterium]|nr:hypothetical protein [Bacteroidota bacterium]
MRRNNIAFLFLFFFAFSVRAQVSTSSPYSRYGIGDLQFGGFSKNLGMGGMGFALSQPFTINFNNPATYSSIALTTFEAAGTGSMYEQHNATSQHAFQYNGDFGYLAMGFPLISKKWGLSFGLLPYSSVGYGIADKQINKVSGDVQYHTYEGSGGLNQFYIGSGFSLGKNFYAGVNASFLFGTINQLRKVEYPSNSYYNTKLTDQTIINNFYFKAGLLKTFDSLAIAKSDSIILFDKRIAAYEDSITVLHKLISALNELKSTDSITVQIQRESLAKSVSDLNEQIMQADAAREQVTRRKQKSGWSLSIGLTGSPSQSLKAKHTQLAQSYYYSNGIEYIRDTVYNIEEEKGKLVLPLSLGLGFTFKESSHWIAGADFSVQNWQEYSLFGVKDSLANSWRASGGFQWTPNDRSIKSYFSLVQYRFGGHFEQTYLQLKNSQLVDYGLSMGFGFPMKRVATTIQIAFEAGKRGTIANNLVELNYVKCTIGFTLNDRWFIKQKFD